MRSKRGPHFCNTTVMSLGVVGLERNCAKLSAQSSPGLSYPMECITTSDGSPAVVKWLPTDHGARGSSAAPSLLPDPAGQGKAAVGADSGWG